jgi:hypothetical protein
MSSMSLSSAMRITSVSKQLVARNPVPSPANLAAMRFEDLFPIEPPAVEEVATPPAWHAYPHWLGAPAGELGHVVPLALVVGRSNHGVVALSHAVAYSTGVSFELVAYAGGLTPRAAQTVFHDQHAGRLGGEELPEGFLRLGIELPDGQRVSNISSHPRHTPPTDSPAGPLLIQAGGGGGQTGGSTVSWSGSYWLWPLPAEGALRMTCEWPIAGIPVSTAEVETAEILAASAKAARIFDDLEAGPSVRSGSHQVVLTSSPEAAGAASPSQERDGLNGVAAELRRAQRSLADALVTLDRLRR